MRRLWIALRVFFLTLFYADVARQVGQLLHDRRLGAATPPAEAAKPKEKEKPKEPPVPRAPVRSEALTLLATLQREARFVDFVKEPLGAYSDAQIGAVARDVHRDCGAVLERLFALRPLLAAEEGSQVEVPAGFDAGQYRLIGNVTGQAPFQGRLTHHGWEATTCHLPAWSGAREAARVVAPIEVELP
jgi:hypothetical protein